MPTDTQQRRAAIVRLTASRSATVEELSATFGVTPSTIRRDLVRLESEGFLARTYGGAIARTAHPEASLGRRSEEASEAKRAIGRYAAAQVRKGETILLDSGSTTTALAQELRTIPDLTVVTTGLTVLNALANVGDITVQCLGGTLRQLSQGFVGPMAEESLSRMTFDRVFLGADGVVADRGICEAELQQTRLKELMAQRADHVYVLAHAAKLGHRPFHAWAQLPRGWSLVTDAPRGSSAAAPFIASGVDVISVQSNPVTAGTHSQTYE